MPKASKLREDRSVNPSSSAPGDARNPLRCEVCEYVAENRRDLLIHDCMSEVLRCKREVRAVIRAIEAAPDRALEFIALLRERVRGL
jgi:hypothetical protein